MFKTPLGFSNVSAFSARSAVKLGGIVISLEKSIVPLRIPELRKRKGRRAEIIKQTGEFGRVKLTIK